MRIGYACLTEGVLETNFKTCTLKNANRENLLKIIEHNLYSLNNIIDYNIENNIKVFRISSDIIPFASSPINKISWWDLFSSELESIGDKIRVSGMRVSMHPGQYTVLNSLKKDVVERAAEDLIYHNRFLDSLKVDSKNKIILHIGGVYGDKENSIKRFHENYKALDRKIKERLVIENDDKSYTIDEVLSIGKSLEIPVVYDNLHNQILPFDDFKDDNYWIDKCKKTWKKEDGVQKIHYSQQNPNKRSGSHSSTIDLQKFIEFSWQIDKDIDIMLEVKDKNLSAIKVNNYLIENKKIKILEAEWSKYKYNILEHSPSNYNKIRKLLKDKSSYPIVEFYKLIDQALGVKATVGNSINSAQHIWGYFKSLATEAEEDKFTRYLKNYNKGSITINPIKRFLFQLAIKYDERYLLNSYYFHF